MSGDVPPDGPSEERLPGSEMEAFALSRQLAQQLPRTVHLVGPGVDLLLDLADGNPLLRCIAPIRTACTPA
jgi:hypothetical protein